MKEEYKLPNISEFLGNEKILKVINDSEGNFITLMNDDSIKTMPIIYYPNILVYGLQKTGKSNFIENILINVLLKCTPNETKILIIDTKKLEYKFLSGIPHLLAPIVDDYGKAEVALSKIVSEIERRYGIFEETGVKDVIAYNRMIENKKGQLSDTEKLRKLPYIMVTIDEVNDLFAYSKKDMTDILIRMLQLSRQAGVFVFAVTSSLDPAIFNRSLISSFPTRVSFKARSFKESCILINEKGAEDLEGYDFLLNTAENRYDGKYKSIKYDEENIRNLIKYVINQQKTQYDENLMNVNNNYDNINKNNSENVVYDDPMYDEVVEFVVTIGKASASLLQRRFKLGYNRCSHLIDLLEERGIIGPVIGSKPREVLVKLSKNDDEVI